MVAKTRLPETLSQCKSPGQCSLKQLLIASNNLNANKNLLASFDSDFLPLAQSNNKMVEWWLVIAHLGLLVFMLVGDWAVLVRPVVKSRFFEEGGLFFLLRC